MAYSELQQTCVVAAVLVVQVIVSDDGETDVAVMDDSTGKLELMTTNETLAVAVFDALSVTCSVQEKSPCAVGVPEITQEPAG